MSFFVLRKSIRSNFLTTMKVRNRLILIILFLAFLLFFFITRNFLTTDRFWQKFNDITCYEQPTTENSFPEFALEKELLRLANGKNIFFHETSCFNDELGIEFNSRQACAVESAAKMNPKMNVNLLFLSPSGVSNKSRILIEQLLKYKNIRINRINIKDYVKDTPLQEKYLQMLASSSWPNSHMSDILRYLTLWRFRGIYLDLDVVVVTSLENLSDFAGAEDWDDVAAGVIGFSKSKIGTQMANACFEDLVKHFDGSVWGNNGPGVITRVLQNICNVTNAIDMDVEKCQGFRVYPPSAFYPIFYKEWKRYFEIEEFQETMKIINSSRVIHLWNKLSSAAIIKVGTEVPYALVAQKYCPNVYGNCGQYF